MEITELYLNGEWVSTNRTYNLYSPYSQEKIAEVALANESDVKVALIGAHTAFKEIKEMPSYKRAEILYNVAALLKEKREEAANIIALEAAKPIKTARNEIDRTIATYQFAAEEAKRIYGETIPMDAAPGGEHHIGFTWREPLGVVVAISPFNFPFNLVAHKLGPAIAAGNTVVLKPAEQTPLSALFIAKLFEESGLPPGALQIITGDGRELSHALTTDPLIKKISFTGSAAVGKIIKKQAGLSKVTLELGSNSALVIEPDTLIEKIIARCVEGAYTFAGQVCISLQRIYVHTSIYDEFCKQFIEHTKKLQVGNPFDENTDMSSMISERESNRILSWIQEACDQGAKLGMGGEVIEGIFQPTVLLDVTENMKVSCEETFAPIVSIVKYDELEDAISMVNNSSYGLNVGIYTSNITNALNAARKFETGGVLINNIPTFRLDHLPYGGLKDSSYGREGVKYAIEEMTELKFVGVNVGF